MKVAIITLPGNFNYGNRLQNYALQYSIEKMGHEVKTIVPKNEVITVKDYIHDKLGIIKSMIFFRYGERKEKKKNILLMKEIKEEKMLPFTNKYIKNLYLENDEADQLEQINQLFDLFVIGSDQVWNPYYIRDYNFYFARFADKSKRVSYAASFGISTIPDKFEELYKKNIRDLRTITVREDSGKKIVNGQLDRKDEVKVVLDPTLLLSREEWSSIAEGKNFREENSKWNEPYILVYFLSDEENKYDAHISEFNKDKNLNIITIMGNYFSEDHSVPTPKDFINLIENAEYVFTDSFHCVVFSIIMHTKFLAFQRGKMNSRIETLLKLCNLEENSKPIIKNQINKNIENTDFSAVDKILSEESKRSKKVLNSLFE